MIELFYEIGTGFLWGITLSIIFILILRFNWYALLLLARFVKLNKESAWNSFLNVDRWRYFHMHHGADVVFHATLFPCAWSVFGQLALCWKFDPQKEVFRFNKIHQAWRCTECDYCNESRRLYGYNR